MIQIIQSTLYVLVAILLIVKLVLFYTSTSHRKISRFIYFSAENIYGSPNQKKQRSKIIQNSLTIVTAIVAVIAIILSMLVVT